MSAEILFKETKNQNEIEERQRILAVVSQTLPLVSRIANFAGDKIWLVPTDLRQELSQDQIIVENREIFQKDFGQEKEYYLAAYDLCRSRLGINLDVFNQATYFLRMHLANYWWLKESIDVESLVVFYALSHESIAHGWCQEKKITDPKTQSLLKELTKKLLTPRMPEPISNAEWDRMDVCTRGCSVLYRQPGENGFLVGGEGIDGAYAQFLTLDLVVTYLLDRYDFDKDTSLRILTPLIFSPPAGQSLFHDTGEFRTKIGLNQFANLYFGGNFYTGLLSKLGVKETEKLFIDLLNGDFSSFFNRYLRKFGEDKINPNQP